MAEPLHITKTTCPYCGVGCGVDAYMSSGEFTSVRGDTSHPANGGRLCVKGSALRETAGLDGRLLHPHVNGCVTDWDTALKTVAQGLRRVIRRYGPDAVAFYVSGQLLTEDYYVANKLMKGFIGSANIDTNSRLCMSTAVAAHKRAFGSDTVPGCYEDLELADLVIITGSNLAWAHPVLYQRLVKAQQERGTKVVVIDPRRTATCDVADLHLQIRSGTDAMLFNGLLVHAAEAGVLDSRFIDECTDGFEDTLAIAAGIAPDAETVATACDVEVHAVHQLFQWFSAAPRTVTVFSQGINQSSSGVDKANAIINLHLATGRIAKPGATPFSVTGQPNAMGGREVGGLANMLAAHMYFEDAGAVEAVARFWNAPAMATKQGLKAVDLFDAVHDGRVKAIWIMGTNPVVSVVDADKVRAALQRCELVVVSDCVQATDTTACAHVLLPAAGWGEKDGTVTNSERRISRQRSFLPLPGEARPDWWIICQVARHLGFYHAFGYRSPRDIFVEHARLSGLQNNSSRDFDISALAQLDQTAYDNLQPVQWPITAASPAGTARMFTDNRYYTPNGRARFVPVTPRTPVHAPDADYPLILNTGRIRDQWHTMTRTGKAARLMAHVSEPFVDVHPADAAAAGLTDGGLAMVVSRWGKVIVRVHVSDSVCAGSLFVPMHWNGQFASQARVDAVVNPVTDPISGQPESKHTPVALKPFEARWYGFVLSRAPVTLPACGYWAAVPGRQFMRYELAGSGEPHLWREWAAVQADGGEWLDYDDPASGVQRLARIEDGQLQFVACFGSTPKLPPRGWLGELFAKQTLDDSQRRSLLAGRPADGADAGPTVCSCFGVGLNTIVEAIDKQGLDSPRAIGAALNAGTNCGSCLPELKQILEQCGKPSVARPRQRSRGSNDP